MLQRSLGRKIGLFLLPALGKANCFPAKGAKWDEYLRSRVPDVRTYLNAVDPHLDVHGRFFLHELARLDEQKPHGRPSSAALGMFHHLMARWSGMDPQARQAFENSLVKETDGRRLDALARNQDRLFFEKTEDVFSASLTFQRPDFEACKEHERNTYKFLARRQDDVDPLDTQRRVRRARVVEANECRDKAFGNHLVRLLYAYATQPIHGEPLRRLVASYAGLVLGITEACTDVPLSPATARKDGDGRDMKRLTARVGVHRAKGDKEQNAVEGLYRGQADITLTAEERRGQTRETKNDQSISLVLTNKDGISLGEEELFPKMKIVWGPNAFDAPILSPDEKFSASLLRAVERVPAGLRKNGHGDFRQTSPVHIALGDHGAVVRRLFTGQIINAPKDAAPNIFKRRSITVQNLPKPEDWLRTQKNSYEELVRLDSPADVRTKVPSTSNPLRERLEAVRKTLKNPNVHVLIETCAAEGAWESMWERDLKVMAEKMGDMEVSKNTATSINNNGLPAWARDWARLGFSYDGALSWVSSYRKGEVGVVEEKDVLFSVETTTADNNGFQLTMQRGACIGPDDRCNPSEWRGGSKDATGPKVRRVAQEELLSTFLNTNLPFAEPPMDVDSSAAGQAVHADHDSPTHQNFWADPSKRRAKTWTAGSPGDPDMSGRGSPVADAINVADMPFMPPPSPRDRAFMHPTRVKTSPGTGGSNWLKRW